MTSLVPDRRSVLSALTLAPLASLSASAAPQNLPPLEQPAERTRAAYFARARALRDQAVREGDQAYGAVVVRDGVIVGEGRNYVVLHSDPTAHSELLAVRDAARRLDTRDLSDCDVYSTAMPCAMCQGRALLGAHPPRLHGGPIGRGRRPEARVLMPISSKPFAQKKFATVNGRRMAYIDEGAGDAIVFQHGNPTSSYLWRNVMPHCAGLGRLIACDLIGMGDSDKLPDSGPQRYTYAEQREYLFALWDQLALGDRIVLRDPRLGLGARLRVGEPQRERVAGIVYMEAIVTPVTWADWPENARRAFQGFRSEGGEDMILAKNMFVERVLPGSVLRKLAGRGDGRIPPAVPQARRGPPPDAHLAAPDPDRGRARRCRDGGRGLFGLARHSPMCRSCSSTPIPARSWSAASARSAAPGRTRPRSPSRACTSCRRISPDEIGQAVADFVRRVR